ncbi:hypothetical protein BDV30DRAFT_202117 [Aspergillus minisclerotigenes]|uniref:DUF7896 domain-containing protein n=1 Tax=Aspergillus minisclerotigenes TaxID=656917 RepID=A0A5N6JLJ9_9EURO|nr:hypothetical protein BDV30DRAFT_202117 [Aspergillus minisclerotigenes]
MLRFLSVASHASGISHPPGSGNRTRPTISASVPSDELIRRANDWVDGASIQESSFSLENCTSLRSQQSLPISKSPVQQSSHLGGSKTKENMNEVHEANKDTEKSYTALQKSWVCVDISPDKTALANSRACHNGRRYDSIYGAAAHLRRTHFNPRRRGYGKNSRKLATKGGFSRIPMRVLRRWIVEGNDIAHEVLQEHSQNGAQQAVIVDGVISEKMEVDI